jgi:hypothetical protein
MQKIGFPSTGNRMKEAEISSYPSFAKPNRGPVGDWLQTRQDFFVSLKLNFLAQIDIEQFGTKEVVETGL